MAGADELSDDERKVWQTAALLAKLYPGEARKVVVAVIDDNVRAGDLERAKMWVRVLESFDDLLKAPTERN